MSPLDFSFPLNVYFLLLQWEEGRSDYLHYGLFERADEPIHAAQARASARLRAQIPPSGRVLEVGIGVGNTLAALQAGGRDVLGITPEPAQAAAAHARHGAGLPVAVTTLEAMSADAHGRFDVMLFQESAQYIQPLALFEAADRLLNEAGATLVVMDEFALRRDDDADFGLHLLPHFKALAARHGWRVANEDDVTPAARTTVDVLLRLVARWRGRLEAGLGLAGEVLDDLNRSLKRYAGCYARGVYGYRVLRLERGPAPATRPLAQDPAAQAEPLLKLFELVFGHRMSLAEWQWKYGAGRGSGMAVVRRNGQPVAFYGGLTRPLLLRGSEALGCQVCDVMVDPGAHDGLAREGSLLHRCTASFLEAEIGFSRRHAVGFGFPTRRALHVAEGLGLYERVDRMAQLRWSAQPAGLPLDAPLDAAALREGTAAWSELEALWQAMAASLPQAVIGVRDPHWLRYRYGGKPGVTYECRMLRAAPEAAALGLVVFRRHDDHLELIDLVADVRHATQLVAALRAECAASLPDGCVKAWITASHEHHLIAAGDGVVRDDLDLHIPANALTPGVPPAALKDRWFLMAGDTDFR